MTAEKIRNKKILLGVTLIWAIGLIIVMSSLLVEHTISFKPLIFSFKNEASHSDLSLTHVLGAGCKCSKTVAQYLHDRKPLKDVAETVVLIGNDKDLETLVSGYNLKKVTPESIDSELIVGVPYLFVKNASDIVLYAGGYSSSHITEKTNFLDLEILNSFRGKGRTPASLPVFGCATSQKYRSLLDPFNLKYKEARREQ